jgi:electron transfer flavoprotein alpha subunit
MEGYENVLVFGEIERNRLSSLTLELLGIGAKLAADLKQKLYLAFLGGEIPGVIEKGYAYGADRVYACVDPLLQAYVPDFYLQAVEQMAKQLTPRIILFGQTDRGLDLCPRLAFRLRTGATLDCIDLKMNAESGLMEQVKPVFGGKAHGLFCGNAFPQIASIRQGSFAPAEYDNSKQGAVISFDLSLDPSRGRTRFIKKVYDENLSLALNLAAATVVVSGGRGLRTKEGVDLIKETASLLGGAIAGSRAAVDNGWMPSSLQVGLTGKRVNPQLYMAVGISGSLQHMAGCMKSKKIVAINSDESAPIFKLSHIGVVGDYKEVLQAFNEEVRKINHLD